MEATGSAALRSRLAVAPVGGPGGRARVADPRSCPILSSRSCSRRSRSTSSGFRAAPCGEERRPGQPCELRVLRDLALPRGRARGRWPGEPSSETLWSNLLSPQGRKPERPGDDPQSQSTDRRSHATARRKEEAGSEKKREVTLPWSRGVEVEPRGLVPHKDQGHSLALPTGAPSVSRRPRPLQVSKQSRAGGQRPRGGATG